MALEVLHYGGFIDGDGNLDPASGDYVAGMPCEITSAGAKLHTSATNAAFHGLFKNDKSEDNGAGVGPQAADTTPTTGENQPDVGIVLGTNKVRMSPGILKTGVTDAPFVWPGSAHAWTEGDELFVNAAGKWDNQATAGSTARGRVTKAPISATDDLHAYMYK